MRECTCRSGNTKIATEGGTFFMIDRDANRNIWKQKLTDF